MIFLYILFALFIYFLFMWLFRIFFLMVLLKIAGNVKRKVELEVKEKLKSVKDGINENMSNLREK